MADINVGITLKNEREYSMPIKISKGDIIESKEIEAQNVVKDRTFIVQPKNQLKVMIQGRCMNESRKEPYNMEEKLQFSDIWETIWIRKVSGKTC